MSKQENTASLELIATKIKGLEKKTIANVIETGCLLQQASDQCGHGKYEGWLRKNFDWSLRTALRYRRVYEYSEEPQIRQIGGFASLNISLSAVYLLIDHGTLPRNLKTARAIIKAAQKTRVGYGTAAAIIDKVQAEYDAKYPQPAPVELLPDEVKQSPKAEKSEPVSPPSGDDDDSASETKLQPPPQPGDTARVLQLLYLGLRHPSVNLQKAIDEVGSMVVREIVNTLKVALDEYSVKNAIKAKADAAEAKSKLSTEREPA